MQNKKVFLIPCSEYKDINPVDCGYQNCPADYHYGPSARDYHILHYVVSGCGTLRKGETEYKVSAGQCFIIRSGEVAYYCSDSADPWTYVWLGFRTSLPLLEPIEACDVIDAERYEGVFLSVLNHSAKDPRLAAFLCSRCWELFSLMVPEAGGTEKENLPQKAKSFIENEYMNNISVAEIAAMLHVDRTVLCKAFKKQNGVSPQEYLCAFRLKAARRFIDEGGYSLSQIAVMCGYKDYCNFSRMFSRTVGVSPREYQKKSAVKF